MNIRYSMYVPTRLLRTDLHRNRYYELITVTTQKYYIAIHFTLIFIEMQADAHLTHQYFVLILYKFYLDVLVHKIKYGCT